MGQCGVAAIGEEDAMDSEAQEHDPYNPGDSDERYAAYETFDAILAAGAPLAGLADIQRGGYARAWRRGGPAPSLVSYGASSTLMAGDLTTPREPRLTNDPRTANTVERQTGQAMDRWEDRAAGAAAMDEASYVNTVTQATGSVSPSPTGEETSESGMSGVAEQAEMEEEWYSARAVRVAVIAGAASLTALALAGGITALIMRRRRANAAREMERIIAASRLLRFTPAVARPDMLEATHAGSSATQHVQQSALETARMARALGRAASISSTAARDFAAERAAAAQDAILGAYNSARGGATGAWQTFAQSAPPTPRWVIRAFNAGRYTGRMEQRLK
jgi:hypothetical protein